MEYIPKLDGVRAVAVFLVIFSHYFDFGEQLDLGYLGVNLFFFLSGYLITSLMVRDKKDIESGEINTWTALKNFYIRRSLRIFPLYYAVILVILLLGEKTGTRIREDFAYYAFYLSNVNFYHLQQWDGILSHFWSLAVEEQYYLFWPTIFYFSPKRYLWKIVCVVGILSFFYKVILAYDSDTIFFHILLGTSAFKFCLGALLVDEKWLSKKILGNPALERIIFGGSIFAYILVCVYTFRYNWFIKDISSFLIFISLLRRARDIHKGFWHAFLSNKVVMHLGLISYGIYVFHLIIPWVVENLLNRLGTFDIIDRMYLFYPICVLATVLLSHFSYFYFEIYFLRLKARFTTGKRIAQQKNVMA